MRLLLTVLALLWPALLALGMAMSHPAATSPSLDIATTVSAAVTDTPLQHQRTQRSGSVQKTEELCSQNVSVGNCPPP